MNARNLPVSSASCDAAADAANAAAAALLLSADIGNTNITFGIHDASGRVAHQWRMASDLRRTEDEYAALLRQFEADDRKPRGEWTGAIICSVVPALTPILEQAIARVHGVDPFVLDADSRMNIRNGYKNPHEVGMDRLANAAGGRDRYGTPLIVVDFGTATTLDVISAKGVYLGGCILPGLDTSAEALFLRTAKLPRISVVGTPEPLGRTTVESIRSGLFFGAVGAVDGLIERLWDATGERGRVVATGGLAERLAVHSRHIELADADLTLHGLWILWQLNRGGAGARARSRKSGRRARSSARR